MKLKDTSPQVSDVIGKMIKLTRKSGPELTKAIANQLEELSAAINMYPNANKELKNIAAGNYRTGSMPVLDYLLDNEDYMPEQWSKPNIVQHITQNKDEIVRIADVNDQIQYGSSDDKASMLSFTFNYPSTAFKKKAAELLDAMEIDMLDNFDGYDDWVEHGSDSPSREVEDLTDELVALDTIGGDTVDEWMEEVAYPYIEKNNSVDEGTFTRTRLMELAGIKNNHKRII